MMHITYLSYDEIKQSTIAADKHLKYKELSDKRINFYDIIYMFCRIPEDTFKKAINGKYNVDESFYN